MKTLFPTIRLFLFLIISLLLAGCSRPRITADQIDSDIVGHGIKIRRGTIFNWTFEQPEPRTFRIVETVYTRKTAAIVIDMDTDSVRHDEEIKGKIRLHYQWVDGAWDLKKLENMDFFPVADAGPYHRRPANPPANPQ